MSRTTMSSWRITVARTVVAAAAVICLVVAFPAAAGAYGTKGFSLERQAPAAAATEPAISPAPNTNAKRERVVTTSSEKATVLAITKAGRVSSVTSKIAAGVGTIPGNAGAMASYGSVVMDGYEWLVKYGQTASPLYAITAGGKVRKITADVGDDITDMTAGAGNTLNFASNTEGIITCRTKGKLSASCVTYSPKALTRFVAGFGQLDAITSDSSKLWFTDDDGELGSFGLGEQLLRPGALLSRLFNGPFGDIGTGTSALGEASAEAHTLTADKNGYLYVAAGQFTSKTFENDHILKVDPKTGKTVKAYSGKLTDVTALTAGPGNNVWFLDAKSKTAGRVGELNVSTGKISEHKLPAGFRFGAYISEISPGPNGSKTLFYTLQTKAGKAAIGEVTGA